MTLHGHAAGKPAVTASTGSVGAVTYDAAAGLFTVTATGAGGQAVVTITP